MIKVAIKSALAHRLRLLLTGIAVMLGVTFVAGTLIYTDTLNRVFDEMVEDGAAGVDVHVFPKTEFETMSDFGIGGAGLPEELVDDVRSIAGVHAAEGSVTGYAQFVDKDGNAITPIGPPTLGMSWTRDPGLTSVEVIEGEAPETSLEVAMDAATASRYGFEVGDEVDLLLQGPKETFHLVGIFDRAGGGFAGATLAAFDLETAQRVLGKGHRVDQIDVAADEGTSSIELRNILAANLPSDIDLATSEDEAAETKEQIQQGFGFFTTVLLVFAAIALFVGAFIILNTFSIIVAQRMRDFGLLRAIGASQRQVMAAVLVEAAIIGVLASITGIFLGFGAAAGLQKLMDAAGLDMPTTTLELAPRTVVVALIVGVGVTLFAALIPARRAGRVPPVAAMQDLRPDEARVRSHRIYGGSALVSVGVLAMGAGLTGLVTEELAAVGIGTFAIFLGVATLGPVFARPLASLLGSPLPRVFGVTGTLARENARRAPRRTASTAAALMVGLSLVTLVAMFAASMKSSVDAAMASTVKSDLIVMSQSFMSLAGFSPEIGKELEALPEVEATSPFRYGEWTGADGQRRTLVAVEPDTIASVLELQMTSGSPAALADGGMLIRDVEAKARGVAPGDSIEMTFASAGRQTVEIDGIFSAQVDDRYLLSLVTYKENFARQSDVQLHVLAAPGVSSAQLRAAVDGVLDDFPNVRALDQAELRVESSKLIDQMLNMVYALLGLALVIAVLGITNTLALSVHERKREIGLLRAVGASKSQVRRMVRWEAAIIAVFGSVLGVGLGVSFGAALISALADEGFTQTVVPFVSLAIFVLVAGFAGLAAAAFPARRAANLDVLNAISYQ